MDLKIKIKSQCYDLNELSLQIVLVFWAVPGILLVDKMLEKTIQSDGFQIFKLKH